MNRFSCDAVVIGAGAVGLAIARALAQRGRETIILEKNQHFGMETSSRNSEVIHAGIYYPKGSLKARLCVEGKRRLYDFCASHHVPHRQLGKWLVAVTPDEAQTLETLLAAGNANGVHDLAWVSDARAHAEEPALGFAAVLESPSTGIIDSHAYMLALLGDAQGAGAGLVRQAEVLTIDRHGDSWRLLVRNEGEEIALEARFVINSAGLWAHKLAARTQGLEDRFIPPFYLAKGSYVSVGGRTPFSRLIYPMPTGGGLGVHLTLDMAGAGRLGPDAQFLEHNDPALIDYAVMPETVDRFVRSVQGWWPRVPADRLAPAYSGVRPRIARAAETRLDFRIDGPQTHGLPGLVNLFGIESPGLTSSLAIAEHVAELLHG